jgi:pimeloyl-ACP methyl ester carboxylesterase
VRGPGLLPHPVLWGIVVVLALTGCVSVRPFSDVRHAVPAERFLEVDGRLVHVEQAGQGEPVLLIHGFGASTYSWRKVIPGLSASHRVVALDLNGFGYTERPRDPAGYSREGQERLILGVLDALGIASAHVVGHSYGGALTLFLASRHPGRVRSMVLVDSAAPSYPEDRRTRAAGLRPVNWLFVRGLAVREGAVRKALERSVHDDSLVNPQLVAAYRERLRIEGLANAFYGLTAPSRSSRGPEPVDLGSIDVPALVLWGEEDQLIAVAAGRRMASRLPRAELAVLPETGHMPMEERPEDFLRIVGEFLARQSRGMSVALRVSRTRRSGALRICGRSDPGPRPGEARRWASPLRRSPAVP